MLDLLDKALAELPALMESHDGWRSVDVTYHPPRVERIWRQWGENRILLHRIHPCDDGEALMHPHPWPSAVRIMSGRYEMGTAGTYFPDPDSTEPEEHEPAWDAIHAKVFLGPGSEYEMTEPQGWHYVRPLGAPSDSLMVIGPLYEPRVVMPHVPIDKQQPLSPERFAELFDMWKQRVYDIADQRDAPVDCNDCNWTGRVSQLRPCRKIIADHVKCPNCGSADVHPKGRRE